VCIENFLTDQLVKEFLKMCSHLPKLLLNITHTTLFTKAQQIQNIDISVRKEKKYTQTKNK